MIMCLQNWFTDIIESPLAFPLVGVGLLGSISLFIADARTGRKGRH